ncbi:MAG: FAD-dependent oxidoreductase [Actinomycetia bacterium]|nr:FAD-dependent oxidoreductase [Actinomycetes bacterium]
MNYDLIVIGGGAAGLAAAREGQRRGARTALVSDSPLGGDCTFTGCVPSKAVIEAAHRGASFTEAFARARQVIDRIAATENAEVLRSEGIDVIEERARFTEPGVLDAGGTRLTAGSVVIATGSEPVVPPIPGLADAPHVTNETFFDLTNSPGRLAILGGGPIGVEMAQATARLGVETTLIEGADRILGREEPAASEVVARALGADGVEVVTGSFVERVQSNAGTACLVTASGTEVNADLILVAVGRRANTAGLGLEDVGVDLDNRGHVVTDDKLLSTGSRIWAAGDVTGRLAFTHAADEMGRLAVMNATGRRPVRYRSDWTPWVTFTDPEVARVGMTEAEAAEHGGRVAELPLSELDRAITAGRTDGFIKLIAGPRKVLRNRGGGQILGATIVAERAGEMIHEPVLAMRTRMFAGRLAQAVHAYPTWSMGIQKTAAQLFIEVEGRTARPARSR